MKKFSLLAVITALTFLAFLIPRGEGEEGYVGQQTCIECHEESYRTYQKNYHSTTGDLRTPAAKQGCESCHGPGAAHSEEQDPEKILALGPKSTLSPDKKNAACLACHTKGKVALWNGSSHDGRGGACSDCHSIHQGLPKPRSASDQIATCARCHLNIRADLTRQSHHPIREGKIKCSDCHNPHGTVADRLVEAQDVNQKCFKCHADLRGPFLWDHPPVIEDCLSCHTPHGSPRSPLLKAKMPYLCQRCHSNVGHPGQLQARNTVDAGQSVYRALNNRGFYRSCLNCHVSIHGSNHPSGKSLLR